MAFPFLQMLVTAADTYKSEITANGCFQNLLETSLRKRMSSNTKMVLTHTYMLFKLLCAITFEINTWPTR